MSSLFHPLCGSNFSTLFKLLTSNGAIAPNRFPQIAIALTFTLARLPFSTLERLVFEQISKRQSPIASPIFIVGYWRSGTTHLHNLLSQAEEFGFISPLAAGLPWDILGIVRMLEPLLNQALPSDRYVDNVAVQPDSPQEDSIPLASMGVVSYYHGLYFPKRFKNHFERGVFFDSCEADAIEQWRRYHVHLLKKVSLHQHGKRLLIKNPVYTAQIKNLQTIWPDAKFIHIYRNPYAVFPSTRHFFTRLLPELALQTYEHLPIDQLILESYPRMMNTLLSESAALPSHSFVEVRFEDLESNPLAELKKIYHQLELPGFEQACPHFQRYLDSITGYRKNQYAIDSQTVRLIESYWANFVKRWKYTPPGITIPERNCQN